jgi:hypothetical protein
MRELTKKEIATLKRLNTPIKIQDFLDTLPFNFEEEGETYMSVRRTLIAKKAHCFEGALIAAAALELQGEPPLLLDLKALSHDVDHVVTLYKRNGYWGAISKTNHAALRFRDPVYKTIRELALSYFHEYFMNDTGKKTLRKYSKPLDLRKVKIDWLTSEKDLFDLAEKLDSISHNNLFPKENEKFIRKADSIERKAGEVVEWKPK